MANGEPGGKGNLGRALESFADEGRRAEAIRARHVLEDQRVIDAISGTFLGTLVETAESRQPVVVLTRAGSAHRGTFESIGLDIAVLHVSGDDRRVLLALEAIEGIREVGDGHSRMLEEVPDATTFAAVLDTLSEERPRLSVVARGGRRLMGTLIRAGDDQVTLRLDGDGDALTMPIRAIDEVVLG